MSALWREAGIFVEREEEKGCFFGKKKQKTFSKPGRAGGNATGSNQQKLKWRFFSKKRPLHDRNFICRFFVCKIMSTGRNMDGPGRHPENAETENAENEEEQQS
jgi:hypothetical protein